MNIMQERQERLKKILLDQDRFMTKSTRSAGPTELKIEEKKQSENKIILSGIVMFNENQLAFVFNYDIEKSKGSLDVFNKIKENKKRCNDFLIENVMNTFKEELTKAINKEI